MCEKDSTEFEMTESVLRNEPAVLKFRLKSHSSRLVNNDSLEEGSPLRRRYCVHIEKRLRLSMSCGDGHHEMSLRSSTDDILSFDLLLIRFK